MSSSTFQSITNALNVYAEDLNLKDNPFAVEISRCDSPGAVLELLQKNREKFNKYRDKNRKFIDCLNPVVQFVQTFSGVLGEAAGLASRKYSFRSPLLTLSPPGSVPTCETGLRR